MSKEIVQLDGKTFEAFVKKGIAVVDFWAEWCGPCKIMSPIFEETAKELKGKIKFGKVNVDNNHEISQEYEVMSIPTMIFFKDGKYADRVVGVIEKEELIDKINEL